MSKLNVFVVIALAILLIKCISLTGVNDKVASNTKGVESMADNGSKYGKCHILNTKRKFLSFNDGNASFKFSVEGTDAELDENKLKFINKDALTNIHNQLYVANQLFTSVLNLETPLNTDRYVKAKFINITLEDSDKTFGTAYDEVVSNKISNISECFIGMKISSKVDPIQNITPSHELFHLYQNSVMMFKQSWLTEGLARWSESIIKEGTGEEEALPKNREQLLEVMSSSYDASKFWTRLFRLIDQNNEFSVPNYLDTISYTDGSPILKDNQAYGTRFISILFDELSIESNHVSELKGWKRYAWKEKEQKSSDLNPYIWKAVKRAVSKAIPYEQQSQELRDCMSIEL